MKEDLSVLQDAKVLVTEAPKDADLGMAEPWQVGDRQKFEFVDRERQDVACIVYSSGTGGQPKGCMLTHNNYLSQAEQFGRLYTFEEGDRFFSILPTNHAIDFMLGFFYALLQGATVVHQRTLRPEFLSATMKNYGITHMAMVPLLLKAIEKKIRENLAIQPSWKQNLVKFLMGTNRLLTWRRPHPAISRKLLKPIHEKFGGRLRLVVAGGAFVDPTTAEFFYAAGIPVAIGYGLTEAGTAVTVNDLRPFRADTAGAPLHGVEVELRDPNDAGIGEVWLKSPTVMKGYFKEPKLTEETIQDGWLRTGDLGLLDETGHLILVGRAKNMIVTEGGKNIYPEDIETSFENLEECQEYCVFAANYVWPTQNLKGEELMIVLRPKEKAALEEMLDKVRERNRKLADFKRLAGYVVWNEEFPRTASMKVKRDLLAKNLEKSVEREGALKEL